MKSTKKYVMIFMISAICGMLFAGCRNNTKNTQKDKGFVGNMKEEVSTPSADSGNGIQTAVPQQEEIKICFIGNSLIDYGRQSYYLDDIALSYGRQVSVDKMVWGGSFLSDYLNGIYMSKKEVKKRLGKADIVVFQDYGGWQGDETVRSIKKLEKWCKKGARFYYYMYEDDNMEMDTSDYDRLKALGIEFIPKGQMMDALYDMSYSYEELHLEGDFHPNNFNGYMSALVMHGVIFGEECSDFPREWFLGERTAELSRPIDDIIEAIHGDSEDETWKEFMAICDKADELIKQAGKL